MAIGGDDRRNVAPSGNRATAVNTPSQRHPARNLQSPRLALAKVRTGRLPPIRNRDEQLATTRSLLMNGKRFVCHLWSNRKPDCPIPIAAPMALLPDRK